MSDSVFHDLPEFRALTRSAYNELRAMGIRKGSALASAHIGIELLLDARLATHPTHESAFREALAVASPRNLGIVLTWSDSRAAHRFEDLRLRLSERSYGNQSHTLERLLARLVYALADRPRLSLCASDQNCVEKWLRATVGHPDEHWATLWDSLVRDVSSQWSD